MMLLTGEKFSENDEWIDIYTAFQFQMLQVGL